jgi:uncharacterized protein YbjT (DUF2867 family)
MESSMTTNTILVLGATGKTGRRVADRLRMHGSPVRLGSRTGAPPFDWGDRATWVAALQGVHAVYVTYYPDLAVPGAAAAIQSFTDLAVKCGVHRLVLLSGRGEPEAQLCEEIVRKSGVEWTLLRASWFMQNFSEAHFLERILAGDFALPVGNTGEPFIDADDIADVAVAALAEDRHVGQLYELTGPRLCTFADAIAEIARETKRTIRFTQISIDDYCEALEQAQVPKKAVALVRYLFAVVLDGRNESVEDGVTRALGRAPRDFRDYVRHTAATGVWNLGPRT